MLKTFQDHNKTIRALRENKRNQKLIEMPESCSVKSTNIKSVYENKTPLPLNMQLTGTVETTMSTMLPATVIKSNTLNG